MHVLIPAKESSLAKGRLAPVLSAEARAVLARLLLARTLAALQGAPPIVEVTVLSRDAGLRALARLCGAEALDEGGEGLNEALEAARRSLVAGGARALLVLPTDLPRLDRAAVARLLTPCLRPGPRVVLARDRARRGTNALFQRPADAIPFCFGPDSALRHAALAHARALPFFPLDDPVLGADLDLPEDWEALVA